MPKSDRYFEPIRTKINESFERQGFMQNLGAKLTRIQHGEVEVICHHGQHLTQQNGFFHAGVITAISDNACGYAALSTMPLEADILTVELKINFLRPANAQTLIAIGKVLKAGKTLTYGTCSVFSKSDDKLIAHVSATFYTVL